MAEDSLYFPMMFENRAWLEEMTGEQVKTLVLAWLAFAQGDDVPSLDKEDLAVRMLFDTGKGQIQRIMKNRLNGKKGGRPAKENPPENENNPTVTEEKPNDNPTVTEEKPNDNPTVTEEKPNDNPTVTEEKPNDNPTVTKEKPTEKRNGNTETEAETEYIIYNVEKPANAGSSRLREEIVDYLNLKARTNYKVNTQATRRHIDARLKEGFAVEDFKLVIDYQCRAWGKDPKMAQYLRPETLFGSKFEGYLQNARREETGDAVETYDEYAGEFI